MIFLEIEDVNKKIEEKKILERIVELSEEFLQSAGSELNYQKITDDILYISGAKYAGFNLYDEDGSKFRAVAFSAPAGVLKEATSLLGFNLISKKWDHDPDRAKKIKARTITHFSNLSELTGYLIYKPMASLLEKTFNFGEVVLVKIQKENTMIGDFTLIMPANVKLKNENYIEIYTRQLGLLITRSKSEAKLVEREMELRNVFAAVSDPLFLFDQKTGAILDVNDIACSLYGYTRDEMLKLKASDMSAEPETTRKSMKDFTTFVPIRYHKKKDGTVFTVEITASLFDLNGRNVITASMRDITERKKIEEELRESEEKYRTLFSTSVEGILIAEIETRNIKYVNPAICQMLGYSEKELKTMGIAAIHPKEALQSVLSKFQNLARGIYSPTTNVPCLRKDGTIFYADINNTNIVIDGRKCAAGFFHDVTERKNAEEKLRQQTEAMEATIDGVAILNKEEKYTYLNKAHAKIYGYDSPMEMVGKSWTILYDCDELQRFKNDIIPKLMENGYWQGEAIGMKKDGSKFFQDLSLTTFSEGGLICVVRNIDKRKKREDEIIYLGYHDKLTELFNRRFVEEEIKRLDTKRQLPISIVMGDLNNLKLINDTFGHNEGDKILKETAELLKRMCRSDDILARWGGDEFVILLPKTSVASSEEIVARIKNECKKLINKKLPLSLAIGIATKTEVNQNIDEIIKEAESNMYKNKLGEKESSASSIISALEQTPYEKSNETMEHTFRIKDFAIKLGKSIKLHSSQLDELSLLASLHDIGKVAIPETILLKEGKLTEKEWLVIKRHPEIGFNIARSSPQIVHIAKFILSCHENWDGSGYPQGLAEEAIPLLSRIVSIADAYDVMTNERIYKKTMSKDAAVEELKRCAGTQFDPVLVEKFIEILSKSSDKTG